MSMLGEVKSLPKAAQVETATVDLTTKGSSIGFAGRCKNLVFNKTTAIGATVATVGGVALKGIYDVMANNAAATVATAREIANPFLPMCPADTTICGIFPDAVAEATGSLTVVTVGYAVAVALIAVASAIPIYMNRPVAQAPVQDQ